MRAFVVFLGRLYLGFCILLLLVVTVNLVSGSGKDLFVGGWFLVCGPGLLLVLSAIDHFRGSSARAKYLRWTFCVLITVSYMWFAAQERPMWGVAERKNTINAYRRYLQAHPAGDHARDAQEQIAKLETLERERLAALAQKMNAGLKSGSFRNQPEALRAVSELLSRGHAKAKDQNVVDCLITTGALLLTDDAEWTDRNEARYVYDLTKRYDNRTVVDGLARKVIQDATNRLHVLFFGIKLGIPGSQERLNQVLDEHGDKKMAEDFLNSGSSELYEGGKRWANNHGYSIMTGMGSHRASWGNF
jgi:hypothetical protein